MSLRGPGFTCCPLQRACRASPALSVRSVAGPHRPTEWTNKGCVCSCQEAGCCCATDTLDRTVFSGCFRFLSFFLFLSREAGSLLFLAVLKHLESPTPSTRWQHREHGHSALQQGPELNDRAAQNGLPTLLASVHSASHFSLRKDDSEAYAFADCFSNGPSFLPNGSLLCIIRWEIIFSVPALFGIRQEFIILFVIMSHFLFYCVEVSK